MWTKKKKDMKKKGLKHPQGNPLELLLPLGKMTVTVMDGMEQRNITRLDVDITKPIRVELIAGVKRHKYDVTVENGFAVINDNGTLPVGVYRVEMFCRDLENHPMHYVKKTVVEIIEATDEGGVYETDEFGVIAKYPVAAGHSAGIVLTEDEVQIHEGVGFHGEVTENEVQLYAEYGNSMVDVTDGEVRIIINE